MAGRWVRSVVLLAAFALLPAVTTQAALFQFDYAILFLPPNPILPYEFTDPILGGNPTLFYQSPSDDGPIAVSPNPGPPDLSGIRLEESRSGARFFELDVSRSVPAWFVSFEGLLEQSPGPPEASPGPPTMPVYAFEVGASPLRAPTVPPLISLGELTHPPNPCLPLFAFGSVHEIGSVTVGVTPVPLPSAAMLALAGFSALGALRRRLR